MPVKALIFDFDGLILDTETPEYTAWQEIFVQHDSNLPLEEWTKCVGASFAVFNPFDYLEQSIHRPVNREEIWTALRQRTKELLRTTAILPGVEAYFIEAKRRGIRLGVASSSNKEWVYGHLDRLNLLHYFDAISTGDQVERVKPDPELYLLSMQKLDVQAHEAVALEDSPNGISAAKQAGMICVGVPNTITRTLDTSQADIIVNTLTDLPLAELLNRCEYNAGGL